MKLRVYTDGASRGNPGPAAAGIVIQDEHGRVIRRVSQYLAEQTSNEAEYLALIVALDTLGEMYEDENLNLHIFLDSLLVVNQLTGACGTKDPRMQEFKRTVLKKLSGWRVQFIHIPRERNREADQLAKAIFKKGGGRDGK